VGARVIVIALAVLAVSVLVIWAVRAALTREETVLEAQARERGGMHFAAAVGHQEIRKLGN
jgi:sensor domain CHASE-containing protein